MRYIFAIISIIMICGNGYAAQLKDTTITGNGTITGNLKVTGTVTAATFSGNGAQLTGKENTLSNSAGLAAAISDETGTNTVVFNSSPTLSGNINLPGSGIWNSSGNAGIGIASPASRLTILEGAADGAGTSAMGIGFQYDSTFTRAGIYADGLTGWLGVLHFATNPGANSHTLTPRMTIRDDKVGIGTTTPTTALHVIGTLTVSSGIVVAGSTMTVPDYVFDESYKLMPLDELKEFIEINKHLPAFKSDIKDLNLVADNMALRKTIEELTLYILQMKNEINLLKVTTAD